MRATRKQVITTVHRQPQPQSRHWGIAGLLVKNGIYDGRERRTPELLGRNTRIVYLMEKRVDRRSSHSLNEIQHRKLIHTSSLYSAKLTYLTDRAGLFSRYSKLATA
ncbi:hypothetical protein EVAR_37730_1 [Eumeta japonica]|uniref:Uncharacterized protein n=1 Tax=Eumeta variegata TaxID=151549 RepID=A0A4C1YKA0_EUMVA|nr:hypothetical protein EVAR_37730_1 [Eumeta japonica]